MRNYLKPARVTLRDVANFVATTGNVYNDKGSSIPSNSSDWSAIIGNFKSFKVNSMRIGLLLDPQVDSYGAFQAAHERQDFSEDFSVLSSAPGSISAILEETVFDTMIVNTRSTARIQWLNIKPADKSEKYRGEDGAEQAAIAFRGYLKTSAGITVSIGEIIYEWDLTFFP